MNSFKTAVLKELKRITKLKEPKLEIPPDQKLGDLAFPCFQLSKKLKKKPYEIAKDLEKKVKKSKYIKETKIIGPYLNFFANKEILAKETIEKILKQKNKYGSANIGKKKVIVMDYSHPNIAKPFGIGHLRSTVIGNSLYRTLTFLNYKCIGVNHLGDWGTQFGKLIYAYQNWGDKQELKTNPIPHLYSLYVKFHQEAEINPELDDHGRKWFKKLEQGDSKATKLWELFRKVSLKEFNKYYEQLNITFDSYDGEAFFHKMLPQTVDFFKKKKLAVASEGALVVPLGRDTPPLLLQKSDGASTYHTRDLAAAMFRIKEYKANKILYIVGAPQKLHFEQLFKTLEKAKFKKDLFEHIYFGHLNFKEGKMSTRKGNIIFLEDVLDKSIQLARQTIEEKNPTLKNKDKVAKVVGIGAVIFADLSNDRARDIIFDWDKILNYEGETAPYIQYAYARICSIERRTKNHTGKINYANLKTPQEHKLVTLLNQFPEAVQQAAKQYKPHIIARYSLDLAQALNEFYHCCFIQKEIPEIQKPRKALIKAVKQTLFNSMYLLGIEVVEEM